MSAEAGDPFGLNNLAGLYARTGGEFADSVLSCALYELAFQSMPHLSHEKYNELRSGLTAEQLDKVKRVVDEVNAGTSLPSR